MYEIVGYVATDFLKMGFFFFYKLILEDVFFNNFKLIS